MEDKIIKDTRAKFLETVHQMLGEVAGEAKSSPGSSSESLRQLEVTFRKKLEDLDAILASLSGLEAEWRARLQDLDALMARLGEYEGGMKSGSSGGFPSDPEPAAPKQSEPRSFKEPKPAPKEDNSSSGKLW